MPTLFSYGTLRDPQVQQEVLGRALTGREETLVGFDLTTAPVADPEFARKSGSVEHAILRPADGPGARVAGMVFEVSAAELELTDRYEPAGYHRVVAALASGGTTWVYVDASASEGAATMDLGAFSVSLAVKSIAASKAFYERLGFGVVGGDAAQSWLILRNGQHTIGLFEGMFDRNMLTFNPGWDQQCETLGAFTDVRALQQRLRAQGVQFVSEADESTTGPASFVVVDPDGNPILVDQHL